MHIILARGDDWEGLYINGKLDSEASLLSASQVLRRIESRRPKNQYMTLKTSIMNIDNNWLQKRIKHVQDKKLLETILPATSEGLSYVVI